MIFDCHVHHRWIQPHAPPWAQIEATVDAAARVGIAKMILLGTGGGHGVDPTPREIEACNSAGAEIAARYPHTFYSFCYLNPAHDPAFLARETERCIGELGMRGIKLWIAVNARDRRLDPIAELAAHHGVPIFFHAWYKTVQRVYHESSPADIRDLALRHPQTTIAMLHLGGARERGVLDVKDLPNVYVDTSGSQPDAGFVEFAVAHLGAERVLYGSDAPLRDFGPQLAKVLGAHISETERRLILYDNMTRLLEG
jgi:predicted TIM-barrel fold metal-dependent hydrolase